MSTTLTASPHLQGGDMSSSAYGTWEHTLLRAPPASQGKPRLLKEEWASGLLRQLMVAARWPHAAARPRY